MIPIFEASVKVNFPRPDGLEEKLRLLQPLEVTGPDAAVIEAYNRFTQAYAAYLVDATTNPEADVTVADRIVREVIATPARTSEGMLLKIKAIGSMLGSSCSAATEDDWLRGDWGASEADLSGNDLEIEALLHLRSDLRRSVAMGQRASLGAVSPELATMLTMWKERDKTANTAMLAADTKRSTIGCDLIFARDKAISAELALRRAILNTPARSFADMIAKFDVVRDYADGEDWVRMINNTQDSTETALWSICGDLLTLGPVAYTPVPTTPCLPAGIAALFQQAVRQFDEAEESDTPQPACDAIADRIYELKRAASFDLAKSIAGALFQLAIVPSLFDQAIHNGDWPDAIANAANPSLFNPPQQSSRLEREAYRLVWSAVTTIAKAHGINRSEYAFDYFLSVDPFDTVA